MKISDLNSNYSIVKPASSIVAEKEATGKVTVVKPSDDDGFAIDFMQGLGKSVGKTALGIGQLGQSALNAVSAGVDKVTSSSNFGIDKDGVFQKGSDSNDRVNELLARDTFGEKFGGFVGDAAQFAIPTTKASKATAGASLARQSLAQGLTSGTVTAAQRGEIDEDVAISAVFGAAIPVVGRTFSAAKTNLQKNLPEWLVTPLLKQSKDAKIAGKDIAPFLVKSGRIGSVDSLLNQTDDAIRGISTQVDDALMTASQNGVTVKRNVILAKVADNINGAGGAIDEAELLKIVDRLAPQSRGLLKKETLTLAEANKLRSAIDKTLGDRGFLRDQLPFNKEVLRSFTNGLRETVKDSGPENLRPLFDDYAKNITLRNALLERANTGGGGINIGLMDLLAGSAGFFSGDGSVSERAANAALFVGGRRVLESSTAKTTLARALSSTETFNAALSKLNPAIRGAFLEAIQTLSEDDSIDETKDKQPLR